MHASKHSWEKFQEKVPPREIWASPSPPYGYLRRSVLLWIASRVKDTLLKNLIEAGVFDDPDTSSIVRDEVASIRFSTDLENHLDIVRDEKNSSGNMSDSEDEDSEDE